MVPLPLAGPSRRSWSDHQMLCKLMRCARANSKCQKAEADAKQIACGLFLGAINNATKIDDTLKEAGKMLGMGSIVKGRKGDMCPTARLRIAFSGLRHKQEARNSGIAKTTVAYTRKSAAKAYIQAQCFLAKDCPKDARHFEVLDYSNEYCCPL